LPAEHCLPLSGFHAKSEMFLRSTPNSAQDSGIT
jgi:hypothetical protein